MNLRKTRPWVFYFLAWTLIGLIYFAQNVTRRFYWDDPNPWQDLRYWSVNIYIAALLTPLIVWAGRRWPLERQHLPRLIGLHLLLSIAWELLRLSLEAAFHLTWNEFWPIKPPITFKSEITLLFIFGFHTGVVTYWVVLSIQTAIRNYELAWKMQSAVPELCDLAGESAPRAHTRSRARALGGRRDHSHHRVLRQKPVSGHPRRRLRVRGRDLLDSADQAGCHSGFV